MYFGATDRTGEARKVLKALQGIGDNPVRTDLVLGANDAEAAVKTMAGTMDGVAVHSFVADLTDLMGRASLAVGAGGTTSWERCCLGLPTVMVSVAMNQEQLCAGLHQSGAALYLGKAAEVDAEDYRKALQRLLADEDARAAMGKAALRTCDGQGVRRVLTHLLPEVTRQGEAVSLRLATRADAELLFRWQTTPGVRRYARNPEPPTWDEHLSWLDARLQQSENPMFVITRGGGDAGILRLDATDHRLSDGFVREVSLLVDPTLQGRGIAAAALSLVRRRYPELEFWAQVHPDNHPSQRLFQKLGYLRRDGWYVSGTVAG